MNDRHLIRPQIDGPAILEQIDRLVAQLVTGWAPVYSRPSLDRNAPATPPVQYVPIDKETKERITSALSFKMKLLNKVLPDLKAVDLSAVVAQTASPLDDYELAQRARFLLEHQKRFADGPLPPLPPTLQ